MADGSFFNGNFTVRPSVRAAVTNNAAAFAVGNPNIVAIIGSASGGAPGVIQKWSNPNDALPVLRGGDLLTALYRCFKPAKSGLGPSVVITLRVNPATQSTLTLLDGSAGSSIVITSANWGVLDNLISIAVAAGTLAGTKVTINYNGLSRVLDNLARTAFSLAYAGGSAGTVTVTGTTLTTSVTAGPGSNLTVDLTQYTTVAQLVAFLNAQPGYVAVALTPNPNDPVVNALDFVTAGDIHTAALNITSNLQAIVNAINSGSQPYVTAARATGAGKIPANLAATYLTGGTDNGAATHLDGTSNGGHAITAADWNFCLGQLDTQDVTFVVPLSSDSSIWSLADQHAQVISAAGLLPRRNILGTALALYSSSLSTYLSDAAALNSDRSSLIGQGIWDNDYLTGVLTLYAPYIVAAQVAGLAVTVPEIGDSFTQEILAGKSLEWTPTSAQLESLITGGVLALEFDVAAVSIRVSRAISTWLVDNSYNKVEVATGQAVDQVVRDIINGLRPLLGKKGSPLLIGQLASQTESILSDEQNAGVIVGDAASPAFANIGVTLIGDRATISFQCSPGIPLNFININIGLSVFSGSVQVATVG